MSIVFNQIDYQALNKALLKSHGKVSKLNDFTRAISNQLLERLDYINANPKLILDISHDLGQNSILLAKRFPKAKVLSIKPTQAIAQLAKKNKPWFKKIEYLTGEVNDLKLPEHSIDLIVSNLNLYWHNDLKALFSSLQQVLKHEGILLFSSLGPDTLKEIRSHFAQLDDKAHVNIFIDMHDIGDAMLAAGLKDPVMDVQHEIIEFSGLKEMHLALKNAAMSNYLSNRPAALSSRKNTSQTSKPLAASFEVIFGHAIGALKANIQHNGEVSIPLSAIKRR